MIKTTDINAAYADAHVTRRSAVPASRPGSSGLVVRMRGWLPAAFGIASKRGFAAPDFAPDRQHLL